MGWNQTENVLSILSKGISLPTESPGETAEAAFGNGVHFAKESTKSLNYCDGMFSSGSLRTNKIYMFVVPENVGTRFVPTERVSGNPPDRYGSYWAGPENPLY